MPVAMSEAEVAQSNESTLQPAAISLPVAGHGLALTILATVAVIFALEWAQSFALSLRIGILFAYTLNLLMIWLERIRIPRVVDATLVMAAGVAALVLGSFALRGQVQTIIEHLPAAVSELSTGVASLRQSRGSTMQKIQTAASELQQVTSEAAGVEIPQKQRATHVVIETPGYKFGDFLWLGWMGRLG